MYNKNKTDKENLECLTYYISNGIIIFLSLTGIALISYLDN